jgi:hypothetical protein
MGSKAHPSKYDCYAKAESHEPMFVLLGRDPAAAWLVRMWIALRKDTVEPEVIEEAEKCAEELERWAITLGKNPKAPIEKFIEEAIGALVNEGVKRGWVTKTDNTPKLSSDDFEVALTVECPVCEAPAGEYCPPDGVHVHRRRVTHGRELAELVKGTTGLKLP